ncbi:glycosyltransferase family 2 protein [Aestuariivirga sp.]|uniref:glycosyltransferase family 2 protein n=1 Tax=Aestuariivirga sp. TaxID=2650926 RepID=UPI003BA84E91
MLRRLPEEERQEALRTKILRAVNLPGISFYAVCGRPALAAARARGLGIVGYAEAEDLLAAARGVLWRPLLQEATFGLARRWPKYSASRRFTAEQALVLVALLAAVVLSVVLLPPSLVLVWLSAVSGAFFLAVVAIRVLCFLPPIRWPDEDPVAALSGDQLPAYSVLVPLFRETAVLSQLLTALKSLHYPREKLDIKLILEEEDVLMRRAVAGLTLDDRFDVIIVPAGLPQTKPRALNYALQFCRGELVTIYDAEDIPEPDQLLKAAHRFAAAPPELACLQAQLTFYNPNENWLTRQFTAEYATLFGVLLPVLANHRLPLPLGGTSNHFRADVLRTVGAWDPFNVTEDADLGLRLARLGYSTSVLDSLTYEEANTRFLNWMRQRARWLKGFLMTWLVHMREPLTFMRDVGPAGFWAAQALTIGVFVSALVHPICMAATIILYIAFPVLPQGAGLALLLLAGVNLFVLLAGYCTGFMLTRRALRQRGIFHWTGTLAAMPLYWMLMSAAAWMALWQFITRPFHWNKTEHGLSSLQKRAPVKRRKPSPGTA